MARPTKANISLSAVAGNLETVLKKTGPDTVVIPVVKADAYGHGAVPVSKKLCENGCDYLAVACIEEAIELREAGVKARIVVLGPLREKEVNEYLEMGLIPVLSCPEDLPVLEAGIKKTKSASIDAIFEVDTGMGRMGFMPEQMRDLEEKIRDMKALNVLGIFSHLPVSESTDEDDKEYTKRQVADFQLIASSFKRTCGDLPLTSIANSGGIFFHPDSIMSAVRPGIMMFGVSPDKEQMEPLEVKPAMTWTTEVSQIRTLPKGACVSYGRKTVLERESRIALLPVGYADGLKRGLPTGFELFIRGTAAPITGVVTMDLTMIDVTDVPGAAVGDRVLLIGRDIQKTPDGDQVSVEVKAEKHAREAGTIPYEILTSIGPRVTRIYED